MADLEQLKIVLRSLVVSSAATMDAAALLRDYRRMQGEALPAARHGFRDPVQFLRERCGDCFLFHGSYANPILTLIVRDSMKHIDQFVQNQKPPKQQMKGKRRSVPESVLRIPPPSLIANTFRWVPPKVEDFRRYTSNTPTHTQKPPEAPRAQPTYTESRKPVPPPVTKPVPVTEPVTTHQPGSLVKAAPVPEAPVREEVNGHEDGADSRRRLQRFLERRTPVCPSPRLSNSKESLRDDDSGRQTSSSLSSRSATALGALQAELVRLVARRPQGVWCSELVRLYEEEYGRELNFARFRYPSVSACACAVDELTARRAANGDWLVTLKVEGAQQEEPRLPPSPRLRRAPARPPSRAVLDPDDALPGIDYDPDVFPADCLSFLESVPAGAAAGVAPGAMLGVLVGEVYSPSHLWLLRLGPDHDRMQQIMDEMTEYYSRGEGANRVLAAGARRPGQYCSSVFEGDWHRSLIVQIVDSDTVKVRHVDYGTVDTVPARALRPLRRAWAALPAAAVRARLAGLRPAAASRRWPRAAAAHLLQLVSERRLVGNVVAVDHEENILELFLIDTSTSEDVNITDQLIRAGHADPRAQPALGTRESYLLPTFRALEAGVTPNYAEIHALLRDDIALEYVDSYQQHVAPLLPPSSEASEASEAGEDGEPSEPGEAERPRGDGAGSSPSPPPPMAANRVPMLSMLCLASPEPASTVASASPEPAWSEPASTAASPEPPCAAPEPLAAPAPAPPRPVTSAPALARAAPPAPAPCPQPRAPHPASFYALPFCPCSPAPCCPKPPAPLPLNYAAGYYRPRVSPQAAPPHFYAQYPRPAVSVGYYQNPLAGQPVFSGGGPNPQTFAPTNFGQNPQMFVPNSAPIPRPFVLNSAQNPQPVAPNLQNPQYFGPGPAPIPQNWPRTAPSARRRDPSPARVPQQTAPSPQVLGSNSSLDRQPAEPAARAPAGGAGGEVRLSAEECEVFELLSRVDPGAAHRYMMAALRRAREAAAPDRATSDRAAPDRAAPDRAAPGLNPDAAEFRCPPPPGFEHLIK